ncbi:MAG: phosphatidylserine/phosphatidylglycerophosphate/cardiolipin synthase family protein [Candidatus Magnetomorum sp.]|nr:phosphatidylserine/phosphatidylglycerophosphate/cardiolipin synthase family protein [Candidatus Magnetomorum sp.]
MVVIKNISITPSHIPNDGTGRATVRCMVFTNTDHASISSVWVDMLHTELYRTYPLHPNPNQWISQTCEGEYLVSFSIPWLMDTGHYLLIIRAKNSKDETGRAVSAFEICYRHSTLAIQDPLFHQRLERVTQSRFVSGNTIQLLENGTYALETRLKLIDTAKEQINIQTYMLGQTGAGRKILDALFHKCDQGVEVNLILNADTQIPSSPISTVRLKLNQLIGDLVREDETGIVEWLSQEFLDKSWLKAVNRFGINVLMINGDQLKGPKAAHDSGIKKTDHWLEKIIKDGLPKITEKTLPKDWKSFFQGPGGLPSLPLLDYAVHEKIMIVDGKTAIVGGRNLENQYFSEWHDLECQITGPAVNTIQSGFLKTFQSIAPKNNNPVPKPLYCTDTQTFDTQDILFVQSRPWQREYHTLKAVTASIQATESHCYIRTQYLVLPDSLLKETLIHSAQRGIDVRILTNSFQTSQHLNFGVGYFVTLNYLKSLIDAGVHVYEQKGDPEQKGKDYHHIKEFMFDQRLLALGSFNVTIRSSYIESENLVFTTAHDLCKHRESVFLNDLQHQATEITQPYLAYLRKQHRSKIDLSQLVDILF